MSSIKFVCPRFFLLLLSAFLLPTAPMGFAEDKFSIRGVIEGFYGPPWSFEARMHAMEFFKQIGFNMYIYAPKDDPLHRAKWREPYDKTFMENFKTLAQHGKENNVQVCYAISPGLSVTFTSARDMQSLKTKLKSFHAIGVRCFALLFDDIPGELSAEDKKVYSSPAQAQADFTNKIYTELKKWDKSRKTSGLLRDKNTVVIFCPTEYMGQTPGEYKTTIGKKLHKDIPVFWTGPEVVSKTITKQQADDFGKLIQRKPLLWDNYPVNDFARNQLFLGPLAGRSPDLLQGLSGYLSNPMVEAYGSWFAFYTISKYLENPEQYDPEKAWEEAIRFIGGEKAYPYLSALAENFAASKLYDKRTLSIRAKANRFWKEYRQKTKPTRELASYQPLYESFQVWESLPEKLSETMQNKPLLAELTPVITKLSYYGKTGLLGMQALISLDEKSKVSKEKVRELLNQMESLQKQASSINYHLEGGGVIRVMVSQIKSQLEK